MRRAYNIVDADGHILEPLDLWSNYIDPAFRDRAPRIAKGDNGKERLVIDENPVGDSRIGIGRIGGVGARQGIVAADTLQYKDGTKKMNVPENVPIVRAVPGSRADLRAGEYIFAAVQVAPDGTASAPRIQVSKDGVRPPQ